MYYQRDTCPADEPDGNGTSLPQELDAVPDTDDHEPVHQRGRRHQPHRDPSHLPSRRLSTLENVRTGR